MGLPESVIACECWARDGLQSMPVLVSTDDKVEMLNRIVRAGFKKLEVTSFSHPKLLPQFADATDVLKRIERRAGVSYVVLMPNTRGFDRFEVCVKEGYGADEMILMTSSSEKHNHLNFRMLHTEAMAEHAGIMRRAHGLGVKIIGCAGTVYGCPVNGDITTGEVAKIVRFYLDEGAQTIMLGDTTGVANPTLVRERVGELMAMFPGVEFITHFHDTRGSGIVNSVAMLELGVRYVDCSIGAIGGAAGHRRRQVLRGLHGEYLQRGPARADRGDGRGHRDRHRRAHRSRPPRRGNPRPAAPIERDPQRPGHPR